MSEARTNAGRPPVPAQAGGEGVNSMKNNGLIISVTYESNSDAAGEGAPRASRRRLTGASTGEPAHGRSRRCGARTGVSAGRRRPGCSPYVHATDRPVEAPGGAPTGPAKVHTVTADSGGEFAERAKVAKAPGAGFLLPTLHRSRERGLNGRTDGPPRRYPPTGTGFRRVTDAGVKRVRDILDARPGKVLGYPTPAEAFARARPP